MSFQERAKDWRIGPVVYQVFVDRFAPSTRMKSKKGLYDPPKTYKKWSQVPKPLFDPATNTYPHVYEFWGGDLASLSSKLDYIQNLGADVLYLNPVFLSPTNHKYDAEDYYRVDPQYGSNEELLGLKDELHKRGMKIMLDGVFNHLGSSNPLFVEAKNNPKSDKRGWFYFDPSYQKGYRGWAGVDTLPAINLENPAAQEYFWKGKDSVVQHWLKQGIDGWRLDVAFELGPDHLADLTASARKARKDAAVVGEISGYPSNWGSALDGVFNFFPLRAGQEMLKGRISGGRMGQMLASMVSDTGIDACLKSWLITDNHDTPRFANEVPDAADRNLIRLLQMTLPGSPCLYYGSELGMEGKGDPECRAPMRWDLAEAPNKDLESTQKLLTIRRNLPALKYGDYVTLDSDRILAYARVTDRLEESVIVLLNPTSQFVKEPVASRIGRIMSWGELQDVFTGAKHRSINGMIDIELPPRSAMILTPVIMKFGGYSPYDRILAAEKAAAKPKKGS